MVATPRAKRVLPQALFVQFLSVLLVGSLPIVFVGNLRGLAADFHTNFFKFLAII